MDFDTVIRSRFSARKFLDREVPQRTLLRILELAQHTASWCNCQPWQLVITRGAATERFRQAAHAHARSGARPNPDFPFPAAYEDVYRERRKVCGVQLYQALGIGKEDREPAVQQALENFRLFGAPRRDRHHGSSASRRRLPGAWQPLSRRATRAWIRSRRRRKPLPGFVREFFACRRARWCAASFGFADRAVRSTPTAPNAPRWRAVKLVET
jgi:nitroreductase